MFPSSASAPAPAPTPWAGERKAPENRSGTDDGLLLDGGTTLTREAKGESDGTSPFSSTSFGKPTNVYPDPLYCNPTQLGAIAVSSELSTSVLISRPNQLLKVPCCNAVDPTSPLSLVTS